MKQVYGWGTTLLVALASVVLTVGMVMLVLFATGAFHTPTAKYYGSLQNEIAYDEANITSAEWTRSRARFAQRASSMTSSKSP